MDFQGKEDRGTRNEMLEEIFGDQDRMTLEELQEVLSGLVDDPSQVSEFLEVFQNNDGKKDKTEITMEEFVHGMERLKGIVSSSIEESGQEGMDELVDFVAKLPLDFVDEINVLFGQDDRASIKSVKGLLKRVGNDDLGKNEAKMIVAELRNDEDGWVEKGDLVHCELWREWSEESGMKREGEGGEMICWIGEIC
eukprot:TRINITY_DN4102_c0_g1_i1.p1 TRINITY_DN4102_c0_g1~~TRINITY_DN4102_c0_g1_i1.p1  ORF type:complete len:195 (-),score=72.05 TRINITY_DN4102_c0_g1_i1:344-928(-)